jgi:benzoyl-CoA reductase/2-hydroxyglutaryl-CoA dehydratase subunit BcrC/BadD/HgdB
MEIPQMKRERDKKLWVEEVKDFKVAIEEKTGKEVTEAELKVSIEKLNAKRKAMQRLNSLDTMPRLRLVGEICC